MKNSKDFQFVMRTIGHPDVTGNCTRCYCIRFPKQRGVKKSLDREYVNLKVNELRNLKNKGKNKNCNSFFFFNFVRKGRGEFPE